MREATEWLFSLQRFGMEPGLERIRGLLDELGRPDRSFRTVLVGGTNGKGATAGALASMAVAGRVPTGLFTSPHLTDPGERIAVDGRRASAEAFDTLAATVRPRAEAVGATFFEAVTAMACLAFAEAGCRLAVLEVGLGGRLDATNAVDPVLSLVTDIQLDHVAVLGGSLERIAAEKAGILRHRRPAWTAAGGEGRAFLHEQAALLGVNLSQLNGEASFAVRSLGWDGIEVEVRTSGGDGAITLRSPLLGTHQGRNLALAEVAARELGLEREARIAGAAAFSWPGRLEPVDATPAGIPARVLLDGAHNPAAAAALARSLRELGARPHLVLGISGDKDARGVLAALAPAVASLRLTRARTSPRALSVDSLREHARSAGLPVAGAYDDPLAGVAAAAEAAGGGEPASDSVLVAGSLYLVGEVRPRLRGEPTGTVERWQ